MLMILKQLENFGRSVCRQVSSVRVAKFAHAVEERRMDTVDQQRSAGRRRVRNVCLSQSSTAEMVLAEWSH
jgi:hypothetical protein